MSAFSNSHLLAQDFVGGGFVPNPNQPNQFGVQSLTDLEALAVPYDKSVCYVEDELAEYFFDAESLTPINGSTVLKPDSITALDPGRWKLQKADLSAVSGGISIQGSWNATTNSPDLTTVPPPSGYAYEVSVAGSTNLGGITDWDVGDLAVSKGAGAWVKLDNTDRVLSVFGRTGTVIAAIGDYAFSQISGTIDDTQHGSRAGGTLHAVATALLAGFMSATDKVKLDAVAQSILLWGNSSVNASTTTRYLTPGYTDNAAPTSAVQFRVSAPGVLRNLYVRHNGTAGNGNSIVYTVRVNGVATALTVSLASTSNDGNDVTNTVAVAQGDLVDIEVTKAAGVGASPTNVVAAVELRAA